MADGIAVLLCPFGRSIQLCCLRVVIVSVSLGDLVPCMSRYFLCIAFTAGVVGALKYFSVSFQ